MFGAVIFNITNIKPANATVIQFLQDDSSKWNLNIILSSTTWFVISSHSYRKNFARTFS